MNVEEKDLMNEDLPPCRILLRSKESVELYNIGRRSSNGGITLTRGASTGHFFYPDGSKVLILMPHLGVIRRNLSNIQSNEDNVAFLENSKAVQFLSFSPKGNFILTWERPQKVDVILPNLKVWDANNGQLLHGMVMKTMKKDQWPPLQWTHDEALVFLMVINELHVYRGDAFRRPSPDSSVRYDSKVKCFGISSFSFPKLVSGVTKTTDQSKYVFCVFCAELKGKPAKISLLRYPDRCGSIENPSSGTVLASKSCYQAEECKINWSPKGDAALILTHTTVDSTGESYYGNSILYLLLSETEKGCDGEAVSVPLPSSNKTSTQTIPVLDAAWMPNPTKPSCFLVISGRSPAMASLHHGVTAEPTFLFGNAHRNTIVWSDHGRFVTLGGFGNLAGGMDFFDRNKLKPIPQYDLATGKDLGTRGNTAPCAVGYGWAPDSRFFMVSTTSPRMNVDNGVRLYKYNGAQIRDNNMITWDNAKFLPDKLLAAEFVPAPYGLYPDRPQSPPPEGSGDGSLAGNETEVTNAATSNSSPYSPPAGRYVPPAARTLGGTSSSGSLAERMRKEREAATVVATKINQKTAAPAVRVPIGMMPVNTKKGTQKEKPQNTTAKVVVKEEEIKATRGFEDEIPSKSEENEASDVVEPEKRLKKLKKSLKHIQELKSKDSSTLNQDQINKIASEDDILYEIAQLELK